MHEKYATCIEACNACAMECSHCAKACLQEQDVKMMARCISLDIDCAAICQLAAAAMDLQSKKQRLAELEERQKNQSLAGRFFSGLRGNKED